MTPIAPRLRAAHCLRSGTTWITRTSPVMTEHFETSILFRHGRACPGHPRLAAAQGVNRPERNVHTLWDVVNSD